MTTPTGRGVRAAQPGLLVNAGLVTVKLLAGIFGHTYALIADAVESSADIVGSLLVWAGLRVTDPCHPHPTISTCSRGLTRGPPPTWARRCPPPPAPPR